MKTDARTKAQHDIIALLNKDNSANCTFHFELVELESGEHQLLLMSFNPHHTCSFLLHDETAKSEEKCYSQMLKFIQELPRSKDVKHYEIQWHDADNQGKLAISHFFGHSEFDALKKLYNSKDKSKIRFQSMTLRPNA